MDIEFLKSIFPVVGGLLALAGGIFTFVSGRLRDADGAEAKIKVVERTWTWLAIALSTAAVVVAMMSRMYVPGVVLFSASFSIQAYLFVKNPNPPSRLEVVVFSLLSASLITSIAMVGTFALLDRIIDVQSRTIGLHEQLIKKPKAD